MQDNAAKTVIISGAYGGIGFDLARGFLAQGYNLVLTGRDSDKLNNAAQKLGSRDKIALLAGDIGDSNTGKQLVALAVAKFGGVDVLVNNAGIFYSKPFLECDEQDLQNFFHANLKGTYYTSQAAIRQMLEQGKGGAVINIGTVLVDHGMVGVPVSAAMTSKGGIHALTVSLAAEFAPHNIRVNTVAPGIIRTPLHAADQVDGLAGIHPLNRVGEVSEITDAVTHLAAATYTTGIIMPVDGGYRAGR